MRIAVFGAGAIGCWVGGRLAAGGADVTLIGRARVMDEARDGLRCTDLDGGDTRATVHAATEPSALAGASCVLVTVKSAATAEAGREIAAVGGDAVVVSLQNGVRNAEVLRAALPGRRVLAGMVPFNVVWRARGEYHRGSEGSLMIDDDPAARPLADACTAAGLALALRADMPAVLWAKLIMNLNNAINALSGRPLADELAQRDYRRCLAGAQREAVALLAAARQPIAKLTPVPPRWMPRVLGLPDWLFRRAARRVLAIDPHARSSMWDDLEAGRTTEVDYIQGEVIALAERLGRTAPVNRALVRLVRQAEAGGKRDYSGRELLAAIT
jgi:2-dehydropantoate 2-reductase